MFDIRKKYYAMASADGISATITLYGDVCETWPIDYWTGKKVEGSFIAQDEFIEDLKKCEGCKDVIIRLNSYGGDAVAGMVIHNRLRELSNSGVKTTCIVDGVAMSAASVIMSACDNVQINPTGLVMIHRAWSFLFGGYNADEMRSQADSMEKYDKAIAAAYVRKTGLSETVIMHMMSDTTYLTGKEAVEKGFCDSLIEGAEPLNIAASATGDTLFIGERKLRLAPGQFLPDFIPTKSEASGKPDVEVNNQPEESGTEGGKHMNADELRRTYPDAVAEIEASAVDGERKRLHGIDDISSQCPAALVAEAKYGENCCNAADLALRAMKQNAAKALAAAKDFAGELKDSGASDVSAAPNEPVLGEGTKGKLTYNSLEEAAAAIKAIK